MSGGAGCARGGATGLSDAIDERLEALSRYRFRASFHLRGRDRATVELRGMEAVERAAAELIERRLTPAAPVNDGKQTPYRGHPVFVAQHATATCCRNCLARHHAIPAGAELTLEQRKYVVEVICRWVARDFAAQSGGRRAPR